MKAVLGVCALLAIASCGTTSKTAVPPKELAGNGYFIQKDSYQDGIYGPVYIFPEVHNSRLIQAKIAWALDVLKEKRGINTIALEGMYQGEIMSAEKVPFRTKNAQYAVQLALFERGEIKAPELMYLFNGSLVFGTEKKEEHDVTLSEAADRAFFQFIVMSIVADKGPETYNQGAASYYNNEIDIDTFLSLNPWTLETYNIIYKGESIKKINERLVELEEKSKNWVNAQTRADFIQFKKFYETAYQRSFIMADHVYSKLQEKNEPMAMIIGANHTEDITEYFTSNKVNFFVINPTALFDYNWSYLSYAEYKQKTKGLPVLTNSQIQKFFTGNWNPHPTVAEEWAILQENFFLLVEQMIDIARSKKKLESQPQNILTSSGLHIIRQSIDISNPSDIKLCIENEKGERIYVRAIKSQNRKQFGSFRKALEEMINRLSQIDEKNLPIEQRIKAYEGVIETFNLSDYTVFISPSDELFSIAVSMLS
jgi:hypothetical protein